MFQTYTNYSLHIEPVHIVSKGDLQVLIDEMAAIQLKHQEVARLLMRHKYNHVFETLNHEIKEVEEIFKHPVTWSNKN